MRHGTMNKDKRRMASFQVHSNHDETWNISHKYSSKLMNNIDKKNLYLSCYTQYNQYINELTYKKLTIIDRNYIQIWDTMLNTIKLEKNMKMAVRSLHLTNCKKIY